MPMLDSNPAAAAVAHGASLNFGGAFFTRLQLRRAQPYELDAVNALIGRAIGSWNLPDRVKRISLPIYHYRADDLDFMQLVVAEDPDGNLVGVAAWEPAAGKDAPDGCSALLLHGIYVDPDLHRCGIGSRLLEAAVQAAAGAACAGLVVKAQFDAVPFFEALGLERLPGKDSGRHYPHRFWCPTRHA